MILGIVGKPNVGKSTFFKACSLAEVEIANRPFVTVLPNHGVGYVKVDCIDREFNTQCMPKHGFCINHQRFVPIDLMDVAGLVRGASEGKGLGNQFLDDLRQADAFIHIVDASGTTDSEGKQIENYDPCNDIKMLENELDLWYVGILKKVWKTFSRQVQQTRENFAKAVAKQFSGLKVREEDVKKVMLKLGYNSEKPSEWTEQQIFNFSHELRHLTKPMIIAANKCDIEGALENIKKIRKEFPDYVIYPCSADSELALREASKHGLIEYIPGENNFAPKGVPSGEGKIIKELNAKQKDALDKIKENVLNVYGDTGVQKILNSAVFELLGYLAIFPAGAHKLADSKGNILPDCFLLPPNSTALNFAYFLHTDFGKNFIKAIDARSKKALGKDYKLKNRDALEIICR